MEITISIKTKLYYMITLRQFQLRSNANNKVFKSLCDKNYYLNGVIGKIFREVANCRKCKICSLAFVVIVVFR